MEFHRGAYSVLYFSYYTSTISLTRHKCVLYADDTTLLIEGHDTSHFEFDVNEALSSIITWLKYNDLQINIDKTKLIHFQTYNSKPVLLNVAHNHKVVEQVDSTTFLGVIIDKHCNWKGHIQKLCSKLDRYVFVLNRVRRVSTLQAALSAYHGYVSSLLRYGLVIWGNSVDSIRAFKAQKKCIRSLCEADFLDSCKPLFQRHNILPLPCLYVLEICLFVNRHVKLFELRSAVVERSCRRKQKLCVPKQRIQLYSNNAYCMAIHIYNKLPDEYKELSYNRLKSKLFKLLIDKCYYSVQEFMNDKIN